MREQLPVNGWTIPTLSRGDRDTDRRGDDGLRLGDEGRRGEDVRPRTTANTNAGSGMDPEDVRERRLRSTPPRGDVATVSCRSISRFARSFRRSWSRRVRLASLADDDDDEPEDDVDPDDDDDQYPAALFARRVSGVVFVATLRAGGATMGLDDSPLTCDGAPVAGAAPDCTGAA